ncbi:MAG: excinuclease ABC subunit UvrC [Acutalibacteraceae bacterium]|nr:excinuclease ABC subunit UvrC [Acutalibacteraceae bacterium]
MDNPKLSELRERSMRLPLSPGVYIMKNGKGKIIYIGKAKVLKNRVSQYFGSQNTHSAKVRKMVENVRDFDYILCQSEFEALILECSLIKQNKPKYNILLKDDKGYSYLEVTNEEWPHMEMVRRKQDDGGTYLGPYLSTFVINESLDAARKIFKLPDCSRTFPCTGAQRRPCLNYHMGYCSAPCAGKISKEEYRESIDEAVRFLRGGSKPYLEELEQRMEEYSTNLEFEKAAEIRDRILAIRKLSEKQKVIFTGTETEDVFALAREDETICFNVLRFTSGMLTGSENYFTELEESLENTRSEMLKRYYTAHDNVPSRIVLDGPCDDQELLEQWLTELAGKKAVIQVPQKGKQFELVNMSKNNAYEKMAQSHRRKKTDSAVIELGELLGLASPPEFIESYDISHTGGADAVGAMVVFRNGIPYRQSYRKFIIKEAQGGDDYGSMREVLTRRFNRYLKESAELQEGEKPKGFARLPDLILMDGGLGQVHIAEEVLKELGLKVPVFGMVKDSRHRTRAIASDGGEITIAQSRKVFALVTGIQDEVHRSAITYHHKRHSAVARHSELTDVPGIGPKKSDILLREFVTIDAIRRADIDTLAKTPGISIKDAASIKKYFHYEN